jgi:hypothetical protein
MTFCLAYLKMKTHKVINEHDPQCLQKFKVLAEARDLFAVTNIDLKNDLTFWSVLADESGLSRVNTDLNSFYFVPKQKAEQP